MAQIVQLPELKPHYTQAETGLVLNETIQGSRMASALFQEAMVRSDMPITFNQISNMELVPQYKESAPVWQEFSKRYQLKDLTEQSFVEVWPELAGGLPATEGGRKRIKNKAPRIGANNEYPTASINESTATIKAAKYGLRLPLTIEMIINDQLNILAEYPAALAVYMRTLEDIVTAEALVDENGIIAGIPRLAASLALGTVTDAPLNEKSLEAAAQQLDDTEVHGFRANLTGTRLVVPRKLKRQAERITSIPGWDRTDGSRKYYEANPNVGIAVTVLDALSWVNISESSDTAWFLMVDASGPGGRPGLVTAFLRGFDAPQQFISSPNALTPAGGLADWKDGSFRNDSIEFKVRHFVGAKAIYTEGIVASSGLGT